MTTNHDRAREWLRMALRDFERAERSFMNGDYPDSIFRAQFASEKACKSLIFLLGLEFKKIHEPTEILARSLDERKLELEISNIISKIIKSGMKLESEKTIPRYGLETEEGLISPEKIYTREKAEDLLKAISSILKNIKDLIAKEGILPEIKEEIENVIKKSGDR